jgi:hypothetical protein
MKSTYQRAVSFPISELDLMASPAQTCAFLLFRLHCCLTMYSLPIKVDKQIQRG